MDARIEIIVGCMFSGKSTELLRRVSRYRSINKKCILVNSHLDTRGEGISTHSGCDIEAIKVENLMDITIWNEVGDVIAVDESQFFGDLYEFAEWCEKNNKILIIAGLDGDANRKPFGQILQCVPICDSIVKLTALDRDGTDAIFTKKICGNDNQIEIGNKDKYIAVSRKNYLK